MRTLPAVLKIDALGIGGAAVITAVAVAVGMGPTFLSQRPSRERQAADLTRLKQEAAVLDRDTEAARTHIARLTEQVKEAVPLRPADRVNDRLREITALAKTHSITLNQVTPAKAEAEAKYRLVPIKVTGAAPYGAVSRFIHELHEKFRDTAVTSFDLKAPPSDNPPKADFTLNLAWYAAPAGSPGEPPK